MIMNSTIQNAIHDSPNSKLISESIEYCSIIEIE